MNQPELGKKICDARNAKGITQKLLSEKCNIDIRTIQRIETGEVYPRASTLRLITETLGFDFFSLSQDIFESDSKDISTIKSDYVGNLEKTRDILIERYACLKNSSIDKIKSKLESNSIEDIILEHNRVLILSKVLVAIVGVGLMAQFYVLYFGENIKIALISNVLLLIVFLKGLRDNYEIRNILKALKEIR